MNNIMIKGDVKHPTKVPTFARKLCDVPVGDGLPDIDEIQDELLEYSEVFLGKRTTPLETQSYLDLQEVAAAYRSRAMYLEQRIYMLEMDGTIHRGSPYYKLRTGQLRTFISMADMMFKLGSRRLSNEALLHEQRLDSEGL